MVKHLYTEGIVPVPPNRPGLCNGGGVPVLELLLPGDATMAVGVTCCSPKEG